VARRYWPSPSASRFAVPCLSFALEHAPPFCLAVEAKEKKKWMEKKEEKKSRNSIRSTKQAETTPALNRFVCALLFLAACCD